MYKQKTVDLLHHSGHWACVGSMLGQRRGRWSNIKPTQAQLYIICCAVAVGHHHHYYTEAVPLELVGSRLLAVCLGQRPVLQIPG